MIQKTRDIALLVISIVGLLANNQAVAENRSGETFEELKEHVVISGAVEVEAAWSEDFEGSSNSDIALSTATLGVEASVVEWVAGTIVFDWDDEEDEVVIDEAYVSLGDTGTVPFGLQVGRFYLPLGVFSTSAVSDPLTLEAFETREEAVMARYSVNGITMGLYVFNGDTNENTGDDTIEHFGTFLNYILEHDDLALTTHLGYLSSVVDSDTLQDSLDLAAEYIGGLSAQASLEYRGITLTGEYITAIDDYEPLDGEAKKPGAFHLEVGYSMEIGLPVFAALSYSQTDDLGGILPETRLAPVIGVELPEGLTAKLEYCHDTDYEESEGGTGEESDTITILLSYEF